MVCPRCGATLPEGGNFCPVCGGNLQSSAKSSSGQQGWQQPGTTQNNYQQPGWQQPGVFQSGQQGWQQPSYQQPGWSQTGFSYNQGRPPYAPALPMKWYKFLIYFLLWFSGVVNIIGSFGYFGAGFLGTLYGLVCIASGALAIYTRYRLAQYRADGPMCLYALYAIQGGSSLLYAILFAIFYYSNAGLFGNAVGSIIGSGVMIVLNRIYFQKRTSLFTN